MKGSVNNMSKNSKTALIFFIPMTVLCTIIRYFQLIVSIDHTTGFYYEDAGFLGIALYIALAVTAVGVLLFSLFDKKKNSSVFTKTVTQFTSAQTGIAGVLFLIAGCSCFYGVITMFSSGIEAMSFIGALAASICFVVIGFMLLGNKTIKPATGYIMLVLTIYYTVRAASLFMATLIITRISESLIELLVYVVFVLFLLSLGRIYSGNEAKSTRIKAILFGFSSGAMSLSMCVAKFAAILTAPAEISAQLTFPSLEYFAIGILSTGAIIMLFAKPSTVEID